MVKIIIIIGLVLVSIRLYFFYLEQKSLFYPYKFIHELPKRLGIAYEEVNFKTTDNEIINGWFIPAKDAKITILYCHGNAGNISHRLHRIEFFHNMGVNFFLFDYRGYGKSSGRPSEQGLYKDAQAAYDYLASRSDVDKNKIVVCGKSLGGAVAIDLSLKRKPKALILESSFVSTVLQAKQMYPFLPIDILITQKFDTLSRIKKLTVPKIILHGNKDRVIPFNQGEILFKQASEPKVFVSFNGGHNDDVYLTSPEYQQVLEKFFKDNSIKE